MVQGRQTLLFKFIQIVGFSRLSIMEAEKGNFHNSARQRLVSALRSIARTMENGLRTAEHDHRSAE